jgi:hypothetical protein
MLDNFRRALMMGAKVLGVGATIPPGGGMGIEDTSISLFDLTIVLIE